MLILLIGLIISFAEVVLCGLLLSVERSEKVYLVTRILEWPDIYGESGLFL